MHRLSQIVRHVLHQETGSVGAALRRITGTSATCQLADAHLTEHQLDIKEQARDIATAELMPHSSDWDRDSHFPLDKLKLLGELGYGGCFVDEAYGGLNLSRADVAVVFENLSYGDVPVTAYLSIHNMVGRVISTYASRETKERYLPGVATLQTLTSYCLTEPGAGSDAASLATTARRDGDDYVLSGTKAFISGGGVSDLYLVMARTGPEPGARGVSAFLVEAGAPGVSYGAKEDKMGWRCQPTCAVNFDGVRVPASARVGCEGEGFRIAMAALDGGRLNIAACSIGGAQRAFDRTMEYVAGRRQFGRRLDEFQATQFRLADLATRLTASRLLVRQAAEALDSRASTGTMLAAMAKRYATDECSRVADECLQLHGGYGYVRDYGVEQIVRDLRVHSILEGTNEIMRHVIWNALSRGH